MIPKIRKRHSPEEETAKWQVVVGKDAPKKTKRAVQMRDLQGQVIVIDDSSGQQDLTKHSSEIMLSCQTSKKSKNSRKDGKGANQTMRTKILEIPYYKG